ELYRTAALHGGNAIIESIRTVEGKSPVVAGHPDATGDNFIYHIGLFGGYSSPTSNQLSKQIPVLMKDGKKAEAEVLKSESASLKSATQAYADEMRALEKLIVDIHVQIPNIPHG
ncbi:unnamed protein product, partial [Darwinula stevensoni]